MILSFEDYLSAKISMGTSLTVFPGGNPEDFLKKSSEKKGGESVATTSEYEFPDDMAVVARFESGGAVVMPDEPLDVSIEVHIGSEAGPDVIAAAEEAAKKMAAEAGIDINKTYPDTDETIFDDYPRFSLVRH